MTPEETAVVHRGQERLRTLESQLAALRAENQRLRDELATTEAREWQRYPLGRV